MPDRLHAHENQAESNVVGDYRPRKHSGNVVQYAAFGPLYPRFRYSLRVAVKLNGILTHVLTNKIGILIHKGVPGAFDSKDKPFLLSILQNLLQQHSGHFQMGL